MIGQQECPEVEVLL